MAHTVRSIGNSVGLPAGRNTNRPNPRYLRKANARARRRGFVDAIHRATFTAMMVAHMAKLQEAENVN